ncbi:MAG: bifunctional pyr operon transcriptional regulator/uracil phosphoribosyltransferase PyrR [Pyrinomonadaceae bacterium]
MTIDGRSGKVKPFPISDFPKFLKSGIIGQPFKASDVNQNLNHSEKRNALLVYIYQACLLSGFLLVSGEMDFVEKARIMDGPRINRALARLASEIVEENHGAGDLYLVGIRRRGVPLAERMADKIADLEGARPPVGVLDITLYRDDLSTVGAKPVVNRTELPGDIESRNIVLIDDVLYTGRTIRAALDQLIDFGRPRRVQLAVLVDRGKEHRELPIQADYIGKLVPTKKSEIIKVMLREFDEEEGVAIVERPAAETG